MSSYFVARIKVHNEQEYQKYLDECDNIFSRYKGKYLAVDESPVVVEGSWDYTKIVIIRFDDEDELYRWYNSDDYQRIREHRLNGAVCDSLVVKGLKSDESD